MVMSILVQVVMASVVCMDIEAIETGGNELAAGIDVGVRILPG